MRPQASTGGEVDLGVLGRMPGAEEAEGGEGGILVRPAQASIAYVMRVRVKG